MPNPNVTYLKQLECKFKKFINENTPPVVDETTRHMPKKLGGLVMIDVNNFWKALRMLWLRCFINSKSTCAKMHKMETAPYTFNPITSNFETFTKARAICKNSFWEETYAWLILCGNNILINYPTEFINFPIKSELLIT